MGKNTQRQIKRASMAMESQMELHELEQSLKELRENLEYLHTHAKSINLPTYQRIKAAEKAAVDAIERIINSGRQNGQQMPKESKKDTMRRVRFREGVGGSSQKRSRAYLRVVRSGR
jgi:hypothetical protein